jgi:hypothetical protein
MVKLLRRKQKKWLATDYTDFHGLIGLLQKSLSADFAYVAEKTF